MIVKRPNLYPASARLATFAPGASAGSTDSTTAGLRGPPTSVTRSRPFTPQKTSEYRPPRPILTMFRGIVSFAKPEQASNARCSMIFTLEGITKRVKPEQP